MSSALPWIGAYAAILLLWTLIVFRRQGPTLWKGSALGAVNIAFITVSAASILVLRKTPGSALLAFYVVLLIVAAVIRSKWLLLRTSESDSTAVLERCLRQARTPWVLRDGAYAVRCGSTEITVAIRRDFTGCLSVRFAGCAESRKAALLRALFVKQFYNSFPTPRIRA